MSPTLKITLLVMVAVISGTLYFQNTEAYAAPPTYYYADSQIPKKLIYLDASSLKPDSFPCKNQEHVFTERPSGKLACISNESLVKTQWTVLNISFENPLMENTNYIETNVGTGNCPINLCKNTGIILRPLSIGQHVGGEYHPRITLFPIQWFNVISSVDMEKFHALPVHYENAGAADAPIHTIEIQIDGIKKSISFEYEDNIEDLEKIREKLDNIESKYFGKNN